MEKITTSPTKTRKVPRSRSTAPKARVQDSPAPVESQRRSLRKHRTPVPNPTDSRTLTAGNLPSDSLVSSLSSSTATTETKSKTETTTSAPTPPESTIHLSTAESTLHETRRAHLRTLQATLYPHLAGITEPNLNDASEVRHFEVDEQGSLTFVLLDGGEAWRLREVGSESLEGERGQMIGGRCYVIVRV